jgi:hypothetical protein
MPVYAVVGKILQRVFLSIRVHLLVVNAALCTDRDETMQEVGLMDATGKRLALTKPSVTMADQCQWDSTQKP